jgi:ribonuclease-3
MPGALGSLREDRRTDRALGPSGADPLGSGGRACRGPILGSACEAVIAALYLDGGMEAARTFIERLWEPMFADPGA